MFGEVIQAAWMILVTPMYSQKAMILLRLSLALSATDSNNVRTVLEWARHSESARDFLTQVEQTNFSSKDKRKN